MKKLKEVTVFTNGDSSKISTWSNIPFFFTETLLSKGIKVNRVDISPSSILERIFYTNIYRFLRLLYKNLEYDYLHSYVNFIDARNKIKKAVKQYQNSNADIFLTFSFSSTGLTDKPIVQLCDWTYDHHVSYLLGRKPNVIEKRIIEREDSQILGSDLVFSLFPSVAEYMKTRYVGKKVSYLGNVINSMYNASEDDINIKCSANSLLFVGSSKYIEGVKSLLIAFKILKLRYPKLTLNVIGIRADEIEDLPSDVFCHGYLDKGKDIERELYYKIFKESKVFINTTPKWSSFSASVEAMYFYIPVIVTPYEEFLKTFGENISFGSYCNDNHSDLIVENVIKVLDNKLYRELCFNAHNAVKEFTWDSYINKIIEKIEVVLN